MSYTYDALYRLTNEAIAGDSLALNNGTIGYTYDSVGNRLSRSSTLAAAPSETYTYDANDRLTSDVYDANGSTIAAGTTTYSYDFQNRLTDINSGAMTIVYDGDGNRVSQTVGGVTTQYLVDDRNPTGYTQVVEEIKNGQVQRVYTYGHSRISQNQVLAGVWAVSFYTYDGQGSVRLLTDAAGTITDRYDYDAFGTLMASMGSTPNSYRYTGEQYDSNAGFYYLRARYYDPERGRFMTFDPFAEQTFEPIRLHKYLYAHANPVDNSDPSGLGVALIEYQQIDTKILLKALSQAIVAGCTAHTLLSAAAGGVGVNLSRRFLPAPDLCVASQMRVQLQKGFTKTYGQGLLGFPVPGVPKAAVLAQLMIMWLLAKHHSIDWFPFKGQEEWLWGAIIKVSAKIARSGPVSGESQVAREETPDGVYRVEVENKRGTNLMVFWGQYTVAVDPNFPN